MNISSSSLQDRVKLSLLVSPQLNTTLEQLAQESGTTKSDVLRKALALLEVASNAKRAGQRLGILDKNRHVLTDIVGV
jgi:predicted transcriptional regulator